MKKILLSSKLNTYKANLHCHTNLSDGIQTPEEVKEGYKQNGYSVVCFTDHDVIIPHDYLNDQNFLALHGMELECEEEKEGAFAFKKACHICLLAIEPDNLKHVCCNKDTRYIGNSINFRDQIEFDEKDKDFKRVYTKECINYMMQTARDNGFFVTYNHPQWNIEGYEDYMSYKGMHAMEICNGGCSLIGLDECNEMQYDDILRGGNRIFAIGADDNHTPNDRFQAFTMIKADKLEYKAITKALVDGNFYASQGPAIEKLWFEDGKLHVKSSAAEKITMTTGTRKVRSAFREKGKRLTDATFEVQPDDIYVRVTVTDKHGLHADTNAYFVDELVSE